MTAELADFADLAKQTKEDWRQCWRPSQVVGDGSGKHSAGNEQFGKDGNVGKSSASRQVGSPVGYQEISLCRNTILIYYQNDQMLSSRQNWIDEDGVGF